MSAQKQAVSFQDRFGNSRFSGNFASDNDDVLTASDILAAVDPAKLHPLAEISDHLDYLNLDDAKLSELPGAATAIPSRGWADDLCYGTGTTYISGLSHAFATLRISVWGPVISIVVSTGLGIGGLWGIREGATRPLAVSNARLRLNSVLNSVTRRGTFIGNSAGVMGKTCHF